MRLGFCLGRSVSGQDRSGLMMTPERGTTAFQREKKRSKHSRYAGHVASSPFNGCPPPSLALKLPTLNHTSPSPPQLSTFCPSGTRAI